MIATFMTLALGLAAAAAEGETSSRVATETHTALGEVHACMPIARGELALATSGGLVHLDAAGGVVRVWTTLDGLPATRVDALLDDGDTLWAGTQAGLVAVDRTTLDPQRAWPSAPVRALVRFEGVLYVGTWGGGLLRLAPTGLVPVPRHPVGDAAAARITSLAVIDGVLHAGSAGAGVTRLTAVADGGTMTPVPLELPSAFVWSLAAHEGRLWVGTLTGLARVDRRGVEVVNATDTRALAVHDGVLWSATYGDGLVALGGTSASPRDADRAFVDHLGAGRDGSLCAAGPGYVRVRSTARSGWREVALDGLPSNDVSALAADGDADRLWVGTFDAGLARIEGGIAHTFEASPATDAPDPHVNALALERTAAGTRLWIATARGLYRADPTHAGDTERFGLAEGLPDEDVHCVTALASGGVLVGTGRGAVVLREGQAPDVLGRKQGLPGLAVWAVAEDHAGRLWLGTSAGLVVWHTDGRHERFSVASGHLADDWVTALALEGDTLWIGGYASGVSRMGVDGRPGDNEVAALHVNFGGLAAFGGRVYAATMEGLRVRDGDGRWRPNPETLGVDVTAVAPARTASGAADGAWVATRRGIARVARSGR